MRAAGRFLSGLIAASALVAGAKPAPAVAEQSVCEQAGLAAETNFNLPAGLLLAIGRVESGRFDPLLGRIVPWPWSVNVAGNGRRLASKAEAISVVRDAQAAGIRSIDTGCFQINLQHHPAAFADHDQAFDPEANARYAAKFLTELRDKYGNWSTAVEYYHSANPERGIPYGRMVQASWSGSAILPAPARPVVPAVPVIAYGMRIWTPSPVGTAPALISVDAKSTALPKLPRITVPGR